MTRKKTTAAKVKVAAETKAKHTAALRALKPIATEVNAMLAKAATAETRSFDLRLSAACRLAEARTQCETQGIKFKVWCEGNVKTSYKEVKRLALVGAADNPTLALEDLRAKTAARMRQFRQNASQAAPTTTRRRVSHVGEQPPPSAYVASLDAAGALTEAEQVKLVREVAHKVGLATVEPSVVKKASQVELTVPHAKRLLERLMPQDRRKVLAWLTERCEQDAAAAGVQVAADDLEPPDNLKRGGTIPGVERRKKK